MKLSIALATRGRPHLLIPTIRSTARNISLPDTRLVILADDDDEDTVLCGPEIERINKRVTFSVAPRAKSLGAKFNRVMEVAPADVYLVMVDYAPHVTKGFDQKILDAAAIYQDGYAVVYNWNANLSFPQINAVTHKLAVKMGGIYPSFYPYWWVDHHLDDIAQFIGRIVFADVAVDTRARQENPNEPWTQGKRDTWMWALLFDALTVERQKLAQEIIKSEDFRETGSRRRALVNNIPRLVHHSMMVNSQARQDLGHDFTSDYWYAQVTAAGMQKLVEVLTPEQLREFRVMEANIDGEIVRLMEAKAVAVNADPPEEAAQERQLESEAA